MGLGGPFDIFLSESFSQRLFRACRALWATGRGQEEIIRDEAHAKSGRDVELRRAGIRKESDAIRVAVMTITDEFTAQSQRINSYIKPIKPRCCQTTETAILVCYL